MGDAERRAEVAEAVRGVGEARGFEELWARGALFLYGLAPGDTLHESAAEGVYRAALYNGLPAGGLPDWRVARGLLPVVYADEYACRVLVPVEHLSPTEATWRLERRPVGPMPGRERELRAMIGELARMREAVELPTLEGELAAVGLPSSDPYVAPSLAAVALVLYASPICRARTSGLLRWRGHFGLSGGSKLDRVFPHRRRLLAPPDWLSLDYHGTPEGEFGALREAYIGRASSRFVDGLCLPSSAGFAKRPMLPDDRYACWLTLRVAEAQLALDNVVFVAAFEAMGPEIQWVGASESDCVEGLRRALDAFSFVEDYLEPGRPPIETLCGVWRRLGGATYVPPGVLAESPTRTYLVGVRVVPA